ncbi:hypothetical protein HDU67_003771 [Dinochytrium kinnereticum]|nr:hypothetical protein HDU67_003771 [Dinochytrium kinnereticum]
MLRSTIHALRPVRSTPLFSRALSTKTSEDAKTELVKASTEAGGVIPADLISGNEERGKRFGEIENGVECWLWKNLVRCGLRLGGETQIEFLAERARCPPEISRRKVRIYRPANTPTQSGSARPNHWKIDFDVQDRWENPLMGWSSSADPVQALQVKFLTKDDAILFAERQGYDYWIDLPKEGRIGPKLYADNFKYSAGKLRIARTK